jgi:hypothetical protein
VAGDKHTADGCEHWLSLFFMRPMRTCRNCVRAAISLPDCPRSLAVSISVSVSLSLPLSLLLLLSLSTCRSLALSLFARRARTAAPRAAHFSSTAQGSSGGAGGDHLRNGRRRSLCACGRPDSSLGVDLRETSLTLETSEQCSSTSVLTQCSELRLRVQCRGAMLACPCQWPKHENEQSRPHSRTACICRVTNSSACFIDPRGQVQNI